MSNGRSRRLVGWAATDDEIRAIKRLITTSGDLIKLSKIETFDLSNHCIGSLKELYELMPYGKTGDLLYIQESWRLSYVNDDVCVEYAIDGYKMPIRDQRLAMARGVSREMFANREFVEEHPWMAAGFMPFWASRYYLLVRSCTMTEASKNKARFTVEASLTEVHAPEYVLPDPSCPSRLAVRFQKG